MWTITKEKSLRRSRTSRNTSIVIEFSCRYFIVLSSIVQSVTRPASLLLVIILVRKSLVVFTLLIFPKEKLVHVELLDFQYVQIDQYKQ